MTIIKFWVCARLRALDALKYFGENPKFDENCSKILQNHIVSEVGDLRAIFKVVTLVDGENHVYLFNFFDDDIFCTVNECHSC